MAKKYYALFWLKDNPNSYVIRFRIKGSLKWSGKDRCFVDKELYVRSSDDMICYSALNTSPFNSRRYGGGLLITHEKFKEYRSGGVARWTPKTELIDWD